jgi:Kef-type K+ transport system membrane component KefB
MVSIVIQLSLVLGIAVLISLLMRLLRQPLIIGYIITGIIVGPAVIGLVQKGDALEAFAHIGVALLLFIVGLGLHPKMIRDVGGVAVITGLGQIIFTSVIGWLIALLLGYEPVVALYLAIAFTFSSTIIILRLLYHKEDQDTLYGRIAIGFLLVQDFVAMIIFMVLASTNNGTGDIQMFAASVILKLAVVIGVIILLIKFIVPLVDRVLASSRELLFLFAIGTCFIFAFIFNQLGFSQELGALVAGVVLSFSPYHREIATRIQPLRDFFLITFFIVLGASMHFSDIESAILPIVIFSLFILVGNPLIVFIIMTRMGYSKRTAFYAGLTVAQISEFSLILLGMGAATGHIPESVIGPATLVGLVTIAASTYFIIHNNKLYRFLEKYLDWFAPKKKPFREMVGAPRIKKIEVLVLGAHRLGGGIIKVLKKMGVKFLVIDHDPQVVRYLEKNRIPVIFGSADDAAFLDQLPLRETRLIISTIPDFETNNFIIQYAKGRSPRANVICVANHSADAKELYRAGAAYVVMPPYLGRRYIIDLVKRNKLNRHRYQQEKARHLRDLRYLINDLKSPKRPL